MKKLFAIPHLHFPKHIKPHGNIEWEYSLLIRLEQGVPKVIGTFMYTWIDRNQISVESTWLHYGYIEADILKEEF